VSYLFSFTKLTQEWYDTRMNLVFISSNLRPNCAGKRVLIGFFFYHNCNKLRKQDEVSRTLESKDQQRFDGKQR